LVGANDVFWAIFGLVLVRRPNDWTELNLPNPIPTMGAHVALSRPS
jgi:hypothetical protein